MHVPLLATDGDRAALKSDPLIAGGVPRDRIALISEVLGVRIGVIDYLPVRLRLQAPTASSGYLW